MKRKVLLLFAALLLSVFNHFLSAQEIKRTIGLSASFQQSDLSIQIPFWLGGSVVAGPSLQLVSVQSAGSDFGVGVFTKIFGKGEKLRPYGALRFGALFFAPSGESNEEATTDYVFGCGFGGEYFFDPHFSVSVEAQVNLTKSDQNSSRFGNPDGTNVNTATLISANIYFGK